MKRFILSGLFFLLSANFLGAISYAPTQPANGPGSYDYWHGGVFRTRIGAYDDKFYLFEPTNPYPKKAPVVIFLHGWSASTPEYYLLWIEHLCRRGSIVIFPTYMDPGEPISRYNLNVIRSVKEAFAVLSNGFHVEPDRDNVAVIGHESGGTIAANYGAACGHYKLPKPRALMVLMPSRSPGANIGGNIEIYDLSKIREGTLMQVIVGEDDFNNGEETAREIFYSADCIRSHDKNYLTFLTDIHGSPALPADRWAPLCPKDPVLELEMDRRRNEFIHLYKSKKMARFVRSRGIDAMDYLGFWRLFDSLFIFAVTGEERDSALGNTEKQRFMGNWSDGIRIKGLLSTERP